MKYTMTHRPYLLSTDTKADVIRKFENLDAEVESIDWGGINLLCDKLREHKNTIARLEAIIKLYESARRLEPPEVRLFGIELPEDEFAEQRRAIFDLIDEFTTN